MFCGPLSEDFLQVFLYAHSFYYRGHSPLFCFYCRSPPSLSRIWNGQNDTSLLFCPLHSSPAPPGFFAWTRRRSKVLRNSPRISVRRLLSKGLWWTNPMCARAAFVSTYAREMPECSYSHRRIPRCATAILSAPRVHSDCPRSSIPVLDDNSTTRCISRKMGFCTRSPSRRRKKSVKARKIISSPRLSGRSNDICTACRRHCPSRHRGLPAAS